MKESPNATALACLQADIVINPFESAYPKVYRTRPKIIDKQRGDCPYDYCTGALEAEVKTVHPEAVEFERNGQREQLAIKINFGFDRFSPNSKPRFNGANILCHPITRLRSTLPVKRVNPMRRQITLRF